MLADHEGRYRWVYEMDMKKNRSILWFILKIVLGILLFLYLFLLFLCWKSGFSWEEFFWLSRIILLCAAVAIAITYGCYWFVSWRFQETYVLLYEMDEEGIFYKQSESQEEKTKMIAYAAAVTGTLTGNYGLLGAGLAAANSGTRFTFDKVRSVSSRPQDDLINANTALMHHMIYVNPADYAFVQKYICERCPDARIR